MSWSLSRFSILTQLLIGFLPILLSLGILIFSNYLNFNSFLEQFTSFSERTKEQVIFLKIQKDIVELQRNVLVFSYTGYSGIQKNILFLQQGLESKFTSLHPLTEQNAEIKNRFERIYHHYDAYKESFKQLIRLRSTLTEVKNKEIAPLLAQGNSLLESILSQLKQNHNFESAFKVAGLKGALLQVDNNTHLFEFSPDAALIRNNVELIGQIRHDAQALQQEMSNDPALSELEQFVRVLTEYNAVIQKVININRIYLHLVNVVLAGKAAEIGKLSTELGELVNLHSNTITEEILQNVIQLKHFYLILYTLIGVAGILSTWFIARGIVHPVQLMAGALSSLAKGKSKTEIPGQHRRDEIGEMAKAANEFKVLAIDLENQTTELEEFAYRTSHDLRSPLVSSIALLKVAQKSYQEGHFEKGNKSLELIKNSLEKLEILVKDILELTRTKNMHEDHLQFDMNELIHESLNKLAHISGYDQIEFELNLAPNANINTLKSRVRLIIENLISNSIKYYDSEKPKPFVKISSYHQNDRFAIKIEDNGLGIPQNQRDKMFTMFKRFHPKTSFGSGLGLYMIKKSLNVIGGTIDYQDTGSGSLFIVTFPSVFSIKTN